MSSPQPGPSTSQASAADVGGGNDGGAGEGGEEAKGKAKFTRSRRPPPKTTQQRQSTAVQFQMKIIRTSLERLMQERADLGDIRTGLQNALGDLDNEIAKVRFMKEIAENACAFQNMEPYKSEIHPPKSLETKPSTSESVFGQATRDVLAEDAEEIFGGVDDEDPSEAMMEAAEELLQNIFDDKVNLEDIKMEPEEADFN